MADGGQRETYNQLCDKAVEYLRQHNISGALELLLEARDLEEDTVQVNNLLGSCYLVLGEYERAVECWQQIIAMEPNHKSARTNLELFNRPSNQFWIKRYRQAVTEVEKKNYKIAEDQLRNLLLEQDGPVSLYQLLGLCCLAGENRDEAIRMWQKGLTMDCFNPVLLEYLDSLPVSGKIESIAHYAPPVTGNSNTRFHWTWAAGILLIVLAVPAIIFFNRETESNPAPRPALTARNLQNDGALKTDSQQDVAVQNLTPAGSDYDVEREEQYYYAGRKAYLARDWKSAADNYSVVVGMGTGSYLNREALYYLARTNYLRGQLDLAQQYYLKYIKQFSGTAYCDDSLFFLGCIYVEQNDRERAVGVFRQLKNIAPDSGYLTSVTYRKVME